MSSTVCTELDSHIEDPSLIVRHEDGSFSVDGKIYLPEIKCEIHEFSIDFYSKFQFLRSRNNFDINRFELKFSQDDVRFATISVKDRGSLKPVYRNVARQHISKREDSNYLVVEINDIVYANRLVTCKCMSSSTVSGMPDQILIQTDLDEFYCVGEASKGFSISDIMSAIETMNRASYGGGRGLWYYDADFNLVRSFDAKERRVVGRLRPIEAIQIASQLNAKGNWAATHGIGKYSIESLKV